MWLLPGCVMSLVSVSESGRMLGFVVCLMCVLLTSCSLLVVVSTPVCRVLVCYMVVLCARSLKLGVLMLRRFSYGRCATCGVLFWNDSALLLLRMASAKVLRAQLECGGLTKWLVVLGLCLRLVN